MWPAWRKRADNPYTYLLAESLVSAGVRVFEFQPRNALRRYDIVHLHWPEHAMSGSNLLLASCRSLAIVVVLMWQRSRGACILWTAHNALPHEMGRVQLHSWYRRAIDRCIDGVVYLSTQSAGPVIEAHPSLRRRKSTVIPLGLLHENLRSDGSRGRKMVGLSAETRIVLCFGKLRRYKGIIELIEAHQEYCKRDTARATLIIAGEPTDSTFRAEILDAAAKASDVIVLDRHVATMELHDLIAASELVVLPYSRALNSASVFLALGVGCPVLTTDVLPDIRAIADEAGPGWITICGPKVEALDIERAFASSARRSGAPTFRGRSWASIGEATAEFYRSCLE